MNSSCDENNYNMNINEERVADLDNVESDGVEEVSNKKSKTKQLSGQKRPRPPRIPVSEQPWIPGEPFVRTRKNASPHWAHYKKAEKVHHAECIHCGEVVSCLSSNGAGAIGNHVERCKKLPSNLDRKQKLISFQNEIIVNSDGSTETKKVASLWSFDHAKCRNSLARMIMVDDLPFIFVEGEGFKGFCEDMNPQFTIPSRFTVARDCYKLFIEKRREIKDFFGKLSSRVCLTTDCWTSGQNLGYMCLTAHFIDADWNLHKKIINFCQISGHSGKIIGKTIEKCLSEWNLKNILTVTVDNASSNDLAVDYLRRKFNSSECDVLEGKYLHMRCAAHILNLVVRDGLSDLASSIIKIRTLVKYVRSSPARLQRFKECCVESKIDTKSLVSLDVETRWNATYLMLVSASKFKKAFALLILRDSALQKDMFKVGGDITNEDWKQVSYFFPFLKIFYDATLKMSATLHVTSNAYVEVVFGVGLVITKHLVHEDEGIRNMAKQMKLKYDKYWGKIDNLNLLLFMSLLLDPRRKMPYVEWVVRSAYGVDSGNVLLGNIRYFFNRYFEFYALAVKEGPEGQSSTSTCTSTSHINVGSKDKLDDDSFNFEQVMCESFEMEMGGLEEKNELEKYLDDVRESKEKPLNILNWWRLNQSRYPILSKMAKDVLAIPVSTVASESAFSTGGRILDSFRTSLSPSMVEALVCGQDWLRKSRAPLIIEETLLEMDKMQEGMEDLILEQPVIMIDESDV